MLAPVDGLGQQEVQVVQGQGGDEGQHPVLVRDLHRDVDPGGGRDTRLGALSAVRTAHFFLKARFAFTSEFPNVLSPKAFHAVRSPSDHGALLRTEGCFSPKRSFRLRPGSSQDHRFFCSIQEKVTSRPQITLKFSFALNGSFVSSRAKAE